MELIENKKKCCGCAVCYNVCPKKAIEMKEDENGYIYPVINKEKCIDCGLCKKMCEYQKEDKKLFIPQQVYAAQIKDNDLILKSASGGIFIELARNIINNDGIVYGAAMVCEENKMVVKHIRVDDLNNLVKLQGSKYVQSDVKEVYDLIKKDLETNKIILFSGTPCQVHGVKSFLKFKKYENLYTIDIICHGVPNNRMFNEYLEMIKKDNRAEILEFKFRDKSKSWGLNASITTKKNGKKIKKVIPAFESSYYQLFLDSNIYRENCYECPYAQNKRIGDITIGDYWKIEQEHYEYIKDKKLNLKNGISCIIVNNLSGEKLLNIFGKNISKYDSDFEKVATNNLQLVRPSKMKDDREKILKIYNVDGYKGIDKWYKQKNKIKIFIKRFLYKLPSKLRNNILKFLK